MLQGNSCSIFTDNATSNIEENSESSFEEIEGAVGTTTAAVASDEDASTISKLEEVKEDLRQVSEALKPFVSKSDESNEHQKDCDESDQDQPELEPVQNT